MNILTEKIKEVMMSVMPITLIVLLLGLTITPLGGRGIAIFLMGAFCIVVGLSIFLLGVDLGITPIGAHMGSAMAKSSSIWAVLGAGVFLGFFISIAEPDLHILAEQVDGVTSGVIPKFTIVVVVSVGLAILMSMGLGRIVKGIPLYKMLTVLYGIIFLMSLFTSREFLAISFDASGATTGAMTVPFIIAVALGVSSMRKDSKASEKDSFGLMAIASTGAIMSVMIMSIIGSPGDIEGSLEVSAQNDARIMEVFLGEFSHLALESAIAVSPIFVIFILCNFFIFKIQGRALKRLCIGVAYNWLGLSIFLTGVNAGFLDAGKHIGKYLGENYGHGLLIAMGFAIGLLTILAEPAVHVLTHQIESVTAGYIKRRYVLCAFAIGVGTAVALSVLRILIPQMQLWHCLLPGYIIAVGLMYLIPKMFIGIAYDAGGVASGPMTATFVLSFTQGISESIEGADVLIDGFGVIAMVAMMPVITMEILGLIFKIKSAREVKS